MESHRSPVSLASQSQLSVKVPFQRLVTSENEQAISDGSLTVCLSSDLAEAH